MTSVTAARLEQIAEWMPLAANIESTWTDPRARREASGTEHRDINAVMLATSLSPGGFLGSG